MRALLLPLMLVAALTACGEARSLDGEAAAAAAPASLTGQFKAASETARAATGDVGVERAGLIFSHGAALYTRTLDPRRGADLTARDGDSYAAIAVGPSDLQVELRRVIDVTEADGLCGDDAPTYVALVYETRAAAFTLLVFAGDEAPGPNATQSRLCARYAYTAPHGARTREGVVLW
jgi:hypothetical protein